jgi:hypothetical protein
MTGGAPNFFAKMNEVAIATIRAAIASKELTGSNKASRFHIYE